MENSIWRKRTGIQLCYPFEEKRLLKWNTWPVLTQPKLDGERCRAVRLTQQKRWVLLSSTEELIMSVPHILNELEKLTDFLPAELDGELYMHGIDFNEIHSRVSRTRNIHEDFQSIKFHIFDLIDERRCNADRYLDLINLPLNDPLIIVQANLAESFEEVLNNYYAYLNNGFEGIIVRNPLAFYERKRSTNIMKFKPKKSDIYEIVGFKQELDKNSQPKNSLGALIVTSDEGTQFSVGSGLTQQQREDFWQKRETLKNKLVKIEYQHLSPNQIPRFPVFNMIIEDDYGPELHGDS